jgi:hypothetical protein
MPSGDFLSYEMTLPGGEKHTRTCTPKADSSASDALTTAVIDQRLYVNCPGDPAVLFSAGGMLVMLDKFAQVATFDFDNQADKGAWLLQWQTGTDSNQPTVTYTSTTTAGNMPDTGALCTFKGVNAPTGPRITGTLDCTWSNGAVLAVQFDAAYVLP